MNRFGHVFGLKIVLLFLCCSVMVLSATEESSTTETSTGDESEGEACEVDGVSGRCVPPHRCFSTNPYIKGIVFPPNCTEDGANDVPKVCCTDCELVSNSSDVILDGRGYFFWKSGDKSWDKCIEWLQRFKYLCHYFSWAVRELVERSDSGANGTAGVNAKRKCHVYSIRGVAPVGGEDVKRGEFPHMVLLGYRDSVTPKDWVCSGALISERFVLTAAHCLSSTLLGPVTEIAVGLLKRTDPEEYWHRYRVARAIRHPDYHPPSKYHDIALLEIEKPVEFVKDVRPACLPSRVKPSDYNGTNEITATGWGGLGHRLDLADTMQKVYLKPFSPEECEELYPKHRHLREGVNRSTQMCYGHRSLIRDTCGGDSGGPLQSDTSRPSCIATLLGITSFGRDCGTGPSAGIYTRVQHYLPWIESIVWP